MLLTDTNVSKVCKAFPNSSSANIKLSKTHLSKLVQSEGFIFGWPSIFESPNEEKRSWVNSIKNLFGKELMNKDPKEIHSKLFLDTGLNMIGKKIKKGISTIKGSGITLKIIK